MLRVIDGLLLYVRNGADILRLDAITYIWADPGTECVHLPETHEIVKLIRDVMNLAAPGVALLTETNVPHRENVSYFGNGRDEAHMVYNFALPPLVLYTVYKEDTTVLSKWAADLRNPSDTATFFNMLDTHDGVGLMGAKEILSREEIGFLINSAKEKGAYISYKMTEERTEEAYEMNTTWWSAVNGDQNQEDMAVQVKRYLASRSIALVLQGVPSIYAHGAIGSLNDHDLVKKTNVKRDVNRAEIHVEALVKEAKDPGSRISRLSRQWPRLGLTRTGERAFHPHGDQKVLMLSPQVFTVVRTSPEGDERILTMTNVSGEPIDLKIVLSDLLFEAAQFFDLVNEREYEASSGILSITLEPYDVAWLKESRVG